LSDRKVSCNTPWTTWSIQGCRRSTCMYW